MMAAMVVRFLLRRLEREVMEVRIDRVVLAMDKSEERERVVVMKEIMVGRVVMRASVRRESKRRPRMAERREVREGDGVE